MREKQIIRIKLNGFKSIRHLADFEFRNLNVLIGANGAGKSNLVSFFRLLAWVVQGNLQFHDTSKRARIRQKWRAEDNSFLKEDGCNIAPILRRLRDSREKHFLRIERTIRQIVPFFGDFVLESDGPTVPLRWTERGTDMVFGADQASDGMLRAIALVMLLLQPVENLPSVVILDEPELGLHPYAITIVAGLLKSVSLQRQIILATQSTAFVDCFEPEDIVVVARVGRDPRFPVLTGRPFPNG